MILFFEVSLVKKKVLEGLYDLGDAFNENKTSELHNSEILKKRKSKNKTNPALRSSEIFYLIKCSSYLTRLFYFHFSIVKFPSYEKLALTSQFNLTQFYDVIIRNSVFYLGFLTREFQTLTLRINIIFPYIMKIFYYNFINIFSFWLALMME